jgi:hypothetical protein
MGAHNYVAVQLPLIGTHKGHRCQEGVRIWPGGYARRRAGLTVLLCPSSQLPGPAAARPGSSWSARSRAAARTNELDAGERRKILEGEEGAGCGWIVRGRVCVPGCGGRSGLTSTHPAPRLRAGGCHDHVSGTGLLSHVIERGAGAGSCRRASSPGAWRPSRLHGRRGGVLASAACISESRCQARVSSLREIAMVAIFFPRRLAMLE